jgi:hypothetical protein
MRLRKSARLIREVTNAKIRHDDIEIAILEREVLRISLHKSRRRYPLSRHRKHRRGKVEAENVTPPGSKRL